jgi:phosphate transport system substrate-binding protein
MNYKVAILLGVVMIVIGGFFTYKTLIPSQTGEIILNGAGASFPFPLIDKWISVYHKIKPDVQLNYQSIGSGGGIRQHTEKTVQFAASDAPLTPAQSIAAPNSLHIPMTIGGVAIIYNIPGVPIGLRFTGEVLADIYLGKIKRWNDPRIVELNSEMRLPDSDILVVYRTDGSGTTYIWTNYLSEMSVEWKTTVGKGTSVKWPTGIGGKGNEGVAGLVSQNPFSIGYVEYIYAVKNNLTWGAVRNAAGEFIEPSIESFARAASYAAVTLPKGDADWSKVSIVESIANNTRAFGAYPITSFSYFIVYKELNVLPDMNEAKARVLAEFLWWTIHDGQKYSADLHYVPLPEDVVKHNEETIRMMTFNGKNLTR